MTRDRMRRAKPGALVWLLTDLELIHRPSRPVDLTMDYANRRPSHRIVAAAANLPAAWDRVDRFNMATSKRKDASSAGKSTGPGGAPKPVPDPTVKIVIKPREPPQQLSPEDQRSVSRFIETLNKQRTNK